MLSSVDLEQINTRWEITYLLLEKIKVDNTFFHIHFYLNIFVNICLRFYLYFGHITARETLHFLPILFRQVLFMHFRSERATYRSFFLKKHLFGAEEHR